MGDEYLQTVNHRRSIVLCRKQTLRELVIFGDGGFLPWGISTFGLNHLIIVICRKQALLELVIFGDGGFLPWGISTFGLNHLIIIICRKQTFT